MNVDKRERKASFFARWTILATQKGEEWQCCEGVVEGERTVYLMYVSTKSTEAAV